MRSSEGSALKHSTIKKIMAGCFVFIFLIYVMRSKIKFSANVIHKELHNEACNYLEEFKESLFMNSPVLPPIITDMVYYESLGL